MLILILIHGVAFSNIEKYGQSIVCLLDYGFAEFIGMNFARIDGFARHFPKNGNIQL